MRSRMALVVAIALGLLSALLVQRYIRSHTDAQGQDETTISVVVARKLIRSGTIIGDPDSFFDKKEMRAADVGVDHILWQDRDQYRGRKFVFGGKLITGDYVYKSHFLPKEDTRAIITFPPKMRAMTIAVDQIAGVAGLLQPQSRVDVLAVFDEGVMPGQVDSTAVTVLSDVTVWAVDSRTPGVPASRSARRRNYSAATLLVTEAEAELLALAQTKGALILTLRDPSDTSCRLYDEGDSPVSLSRLLEASGRAKRTRAGVETP